GNLDRLESETGDPPRVSGAAEIEAVCVELVVPNRYEERVAGNLAGGRRIRARARDLRPPRAPASADVDDGHRARPPPALGPAELGERRAAEHTECAPDWPAAIRSTRVPPVLPVEAEAIARSPVRPMVVGVGADLAERPDDERVAVLVDLVRVEDLRGRRRQIAVDPVVRDRGTGAGDAAEAHQVALEKADAEAVVADGRRPVLGREPARAGAEEVAGVLGDLAQRRAGVRPRPVVREDAVGTAGRVQRGELL